MRLWRYGRAAGVECFCIGLGQILGCVPVDTVAPLAFSFGMVLLGVTVQVFVEWLVAARLPAGPV